MSIAIAIVTLALQFVGEFLIDAAVYAGADADSMASRRLFFALAFVFLAVGPALAGSRNGVGALRQKDYAAALRIFTPLAKRGDPIAETYLGYMYAHGYGVPENYNLAADWLHAASEQGSSLAQYWLGLMFDKGQGVPQDYVLAYKWLDLAAAGARGRERNDWARIRDAVGTKLTLAQRTKAQALAAAWRPHRHP